MYIQKANAELDRNGTDTAALARGREVFATIDGVLDLRPRVARLVVGPEAVEPDPATLPDTEPVEQEAIAWAVERLRSRLAARKARDFAQSDALRAEVEGRGFVVKDTALGTQLERWR